MESSLALSKTEKEIEDHVLNKTIPLSDGTTELIFARSARNEQGFFVYSCYVCNVMSLPGEACLQNHISGRRHTIKMSSKPLDAAAFRAAALPKSTAPKIAMDIAPGEPPPPGFENEIKLVAEIQPVLNRFKEASLVALEYLMELKTPGAHECSYHCILCDKRGDPRTILAHLVSINHRLKYLEKHFPSVIRLLAPLRTTRHASAHVQLKESVASVCQAIEAQHGRMTPTVFNASDYEQHKHKVIQDSIFEKHFDERTGPSFVEAVDTEAIDRAMQKATSELEGLEMPFQPLIKPLKRPNGNPFKPKLLPRVVNLEPETTIEIKDDVSSISSGSIGSRSRSRSPKRHRPSQRRRSPVRGRRSRSPGSRRKTALGDSRVKLQHLETMRTEKSSFTRNKTDRCREEIDKVVSKLEEEFQEFNKSPESHPQYNEEWKKFWNRRYKELQNEKRDPSKYDFKPEWIEFWTKRMKQLYDEDVSRRVKEIKQKYKESPARVLGRSKSREKSRRSRSTSRPRRSRSRSRSFSYSRGSPRRMRSFSPPEDSKSRRDPYKSAHYNEPHYPHYAPPIYPPYGDPYAYYPPYKAPYASEKPAPEKKAEPEEEETNEPLTFVSMCRLLTAMEDYLGSLGPRCIDLLSRALALEKVKANSSDEKLLTEENCVFFETVKEKLKGLIAANMVSEKKERVVRKAIKNIAELIHSATKKMADRREEMRQEKEEEFSSLISRIKSALIVQGKTDISVPQLDSLLDFFLEIAKHNSKSKYPMRVKEFLVEKKFVKGDPKKAEDSLENGSSFESLTDSDLQTLLQNFKDLSGDEQHQLIAYLKSLELSDPVRVKKLRSYCVGMDNSPPPSRVQRSPTPPPARRSFEDRFERRPAAPSQPAVNIFDSDEDDDYTYDDLVKSSKSSQQSSVRLELPQSAMEEEEDEEEPKTDPRLAPPPKSSSMNESVAAVSKTLTVQDTQQLIASLMGSLHQSIGQKPAPPAQQFPTSQSKSNLNESYNQFIQSTYQQTASQPTQSQQLFPIPISHLQQTQASNYGQAQQFQQMQQQQQQQQTQYTGYQNLGGGANNRPQHTSYVMPQQTPSSQPFYQYYRKQ